MIKKIAVGFFLLLISLSGSSQGYLGARDSKYIFGGYRFKCGIFLDLEQSIYFEHFSYQKTRMYAGWRHEWKTVDLNARIYGSYAWKEKYKDAGLLLTGAVRPFRIWAIDGTINPHFDSVEGYFTLFSAGTGVQVHKDITLIAHYTTIPEYRMSEKRIRLGVKFGVRNLEVQPEISIPTDGTSKILRFLFSMKYTFGSD